MRIGRLSSLAVFVAVACGGGTASAPSDSGASDATAVDAANDAANDAAPDARARDAGADAADAPIDATTSEDSSVVDAGSVDAQNAFDGAVCSGTPGTFHSQVIVVGGEARFYFLHVPAGYRCSDAPWPMLVDFHGTCTDSDGPPEECWTLADAVAASDRDGYILVRPRSRFSTEGGTNLYRWDENAGDIPLNVAFTKALVASLDVSFHVDPARTYAMGFSSGTNMASQFLASSNAIFAGIGTVCGGMWDDPGLPAFGPAAPRVYAVDGYRDYFYPMLRNLVGGLGAHGYPASRLFVRETNAGHELYGWHYKETFAWLDRGERPAPGQLAAGWAKESTGTTETLLRAVVAPAGDLVVTGADGGFYTRARTSGAWMKVTTLRAGGLAPHFTGMCFSPSGSGIAVGDQHVAVSGDQGATWALGSPIPAYTSQSPVEGAYGNDAVCTGAARVVVAGDWIGATTSDGAHTWAVDPMPYSPADTTDYGSSNALAVAPGGTTIAAGWAGYVGRAAGGAASFTAVPNVYGPDWWNGVAVTSGGAFVLVGEAGWIARSTDDGATFATMTLPGADDLYAVAFRADGVGVAVGAHGYAALTRDSGATWTGAPTGLDTMLASVVFLADGSARVVGEGGVALSYHP